MNDLCACLCMQFRTNDLFQLPSVSLWGVEVLHLWRKSVTGVMCCICASSSPFRLYVSPDYARDSKLFSSCIINKGVCSPNSLYSCLRLWIVNVRSSSLFSPVELFSLCTSYCKSLCDKEPYTMWYLLSFWLACFYCLISIIMFKNLLKVCTFNCLE